MAPRDVASTAFTLPVLPYPEDALAPVISAETLRFHHGKHHRTYVETLNKLVKGTPFAEMALEEIIKETSGDEENKKVFNNAAQVWNHTFYWNCLSPKPRAPSEPLMQAINHDFGSFSALKKQLAEKAIEHFGSGYAWLVLEKGKLAVRDLPNADTPVASGTPCLLTLDVWEHAYYIDYRNVRKDHVNAVIDKLLDWGFASENFARATGAEWDIELPAAPGGARGQFLLP